MALFAIEDCSSFFAHGLPRDGLHLPRVQFFSASCYFFLAGGLGVGVEDRLQTLDESTRQFGALLLGQGQRLL